MTSWKEQSTSTDDTPKAGKTFDEKFCIFCQTDIAHSKVMSGDTGSKLLLIKEHSTSDEIRARLAYLQNDNDALAQNMKYHLNCLRNATGCSK